MNFINPILFLEHTVLQNIRIQKLISFEHGNITGKCQFPEQCFQTFNVIRYMLAVLFTMSGSHVTVWLVVNYNCWMHVGKFRATPKNRAWQGFNGVRNLKKISLTRWDWTHFLCFRPDIFVAHLSFKSVWYLNFVCCSVFADTLWETIINHMLFSTIS